MGIVAFVEDQVVMRKILTYIASGCFRSALHPSLFSVIWMNMTLSLESYSPSSGRLFLSFTERRTPCARS